MYTKLLVTCETVRPFMRSRISCMKLGTHMSVWDAQCMCTIRNWVLTWVYEMLGTHLSVSYQKYSLEWFSIPRYSVECVQFMSFKALPSFLTHLCPPLRSKFAVRETASLGIMGEPRVPPLNPSETIVLICCQKSFASSNGGKGDSSCWDLFKAELSCF